MPSLARRPFGSQRVIEGAGQKTDKAAAGVHRKLPCKDSAADVVHINADEIKTAGQLFRDSDHIFVFGRRLNRMSVTGQIECERIGSKAPVESLSDMLFVAVEMNGEALRAAIKAPEFVVGPIGKIKAFSAIG